MSDRQFDLLEIKAHLDGPTTSPLFLLDACRWLTDEVERIRNLKGVLMELGNRLVTEHGWGPGPASLVHSIHGSRYGDDPAYRRGNVTAMLIALTEMINRTPEMQRALESMGGDWPTVKETE